MLVHSGERPFTCKICGMSFTTNGNMHRHMRTHGDVSLDASAVEEVEVVTKEDTDQDEPEDVEDSPEVPESKLFCPVCGKVFLSEIDLDEHMKFHPNNPIMCQKCDKISANYTTHVDHKCEIVEPKLPLKREDVCGFQDLNFIDFTTDKFALVSKKYCEQNIKRPISAFHIYECKDCKKTFPCSRALKLHEKVHESEITFCPTCDCDFTTTSFLQVHKLKHRSAEQCLSHSLQSNEITKKSLLAGKEDFLALLNLQKQSILKNLKPCDVKEDPLENYDYFVHGKLVKRENEEVDGCNNNDFADIQSILTLTSKTPLISAAQTSPVRVRPVSPAPFAGHQPKSPPIAESANASPATPSKEELPNTLNNHDGPDLERIVRVNGMFPCKVCGEEFKVLNALKRHSKSHAQKGLNHSCDVCSYVSVDKSTLIRHLRTHNGERPFQCVICKYAFTTKANCERHVKKKHKRFSKAEIRNAMQYNPNMSYRSGSDSSIDISNSETVCKYCGADFKFNRVLRHHLRSLQNSCNNKPFSCKVCNYGFSTKNNCIRHVLKQHPGFKDRLRSVVVPNNSSRQVTNSEMTSSPDNSNSSFGNQPVTEESQPLDLHCNGTNTATDLQVEKTAEFNAKEAVIAAESLVSLSEAPPLQEEPLNLVAHALDLSCKPLDVVSKELEPKPASIFNVTSNTLKPVGFIDVATSKSTIPVPATENKTQISPLPKTNCSKKMDVLSNSDTPTNTPGQKRRSFTCMYCSAGFTLKSNMERHIKRKHPEYARPTRSRNYIPSIVSPNLQKQNSTTLSDKTRDALRHVLSTKVQQVPVYKNFNAEVFPKAGSTFKIVAPTHTFITPVTQVAGSKSILNLSLDLNAKNEKVTIVDLNPNVLKTAENGGDETCSDLASVSSVICTANSPQFKQYLAKSTDIEKLDASESEKKNENQETLPDSESIKKNESTSVSCPFCERKFPWTSSLRRHILTHTGQKPYKCPKCSLWFTTKSNCERHLVRKHGHKGDLITRSVPDRPYKCNHCLTSTFSTQGNLRKHFYLKHWTKSYMGMNCKPVQLDKKNGDISDATLPFGILQPFKLSKSNNVTSVTTQEHSYSQLEKKLAFACNFCDISFANLTDLSSHMLKHNSVMYMCYLCRKTFQNHEDCFSHFKTSHSLVYMQINLTDENGMKPSEEDNLEDISEAASPEKNSSIACMVCFQKMSSLENLQQHFKRHLSKEKADCLDQVKQISSKEITPPSSKASPGPSKSPPNHISKKHRLPSKVKNTLLHLFATSSKNIKSKELGSPPEENTDLIQNLLGIEDSKIVEECLVYPHSAARILGVQK
ncbi:ras-responsive element-binding protein 1 [Trichonephila clavipes]|nr:ras-responsive element-binding protein 1 [Trichonephila clavipes]